MEPTIHILLLSGQATRNLIRQGQAMDWFGLDYMEMELIEARPCSAQTQKEICTV